MALYDARMGTPLRKLVMLRRANKLAWNPREAFNFTVASEDNNLYSFDMRKLDIATSVHKDFVSVCHIIGLPPEAAASHACSRAGRDGRGLLAHRTRVCSRFLRPLGPHLPMQWWPQPGGVSHETDATACFFCALLRCGYLTNCTRALAPSVSSVRFSGDGQYVFSGSEDMNVRIWKARASEQLGTVCCCKSCVAMHI